jgi:hypothetical protein
MPGSVNVRAVAASRARPYTAAMAKRAKARPRKPAPESTKPMRRFTIRATSEQWARWKRSAERVHRKRNDWIRVTLDFVARD